MTPACPNRDDLCEPVAVRSGSIGGLREALVPGEPVPHRANAQMQHAAPRNSSSSLRRALGLIEVVATRHAAGGCTLTELAADAGLARSTVARLVAPLLDHGYVEVEPASGRPRLGAAVARLGSTYLHLHGPGQRAAALVPPPVPMSEALVTTRVVAILRAEPRVEAASS
jgi:DNA-binding transcriptional ArsR family regulator